MPIDLKFQTDVRKFIQLIEDNTERVLSGVAQDIHAELVARTPIHSGRARASWNINPFTADPTPAPSLGDDYNGSAAAPEKLQVARAYYGPIAAAKNVFIANPGEDVIVISNSVDYIEDLNNGTSTQAPAGFFQSTVAGIAAKMQRMINKLNAPF